MLSDIVFSVGAIKTLMSLPYLSCLGLLVPISLADERAGLVGAQEGYLMHENGCSYQSTGPEIPQQREEEYSIKVLENQDRSL